MTTVKTFMDAMTSAQTSIEPIAFVMIDVV